MAPSILLSDGDGSDTGVGTNQERIDPRESFATAGDRFIPAERGHAMDCTCGVARREALLRERVSLPDAARRSDHERFLELLSPTGILSYPDILDLDEKFGR